jgi:iron(III) transport system ATP-binding protein
MVFQDFALFPHLSVEGNIAFGLRASPARGAPRRASRSCWSWSGSPTPPAYPHQLSGGMQQRVALARAMAPRPEILLLDEPFSSMDAALREQLAREVREVLKREGVTAILVTHDQTGGLRHGRPDRSPGAGRDPPVGNRLRALPRAPNRFVADFIGQGVILPATVVDETRVKTELGRVAGEHPHGLPPGSPAEVLIRPDDLLYDESSPRRAIVVERAFRGAEYLYTLRLASGTEVLCLVPSHHQHAVGDEIGIRLEADHLVVFPRDARASTDAR